MRILRILFLTPFLVEAVGPEARGLELLVKAIEILDSSAPESEPEERVMQNRPKFPRYSLRLPEATDEELRYLLGRVRRNRAVEKGRLIRDFRYRFPTSQVSALEAYVDILLEIDAISESSYLQLVAHALHYGGPPPTSLQVKDPIRKLMLWYDHVVVPGESPVVQGEGVLRMTNAQYMGVVDELRSEVSASPIAEHFAEMDECYRDCPTPDDAPTFKDMETFAIRLLQREVGDMPMEIFMGNFKSMFPHSDPNIDRMIRALKQLRCVSPVVLADPVADVLFELRMWKWIVVRSGVPPVHQNGKDCLNDHQYWMLLESLRMVTDNTVFRSFLCDVSLNHLGCFFYETPGRTAGHPNVHHQFDLIRLAVIERMLGHLSTYCRPIAASFPKNVRTVAFRFCGHMKEASSLDARLHWFLIDYVKQGGEPRPVAELIIEASSMYPLATKIHREYVMDWFDIVIADPRADSHPTYSAGGKRAEGSFVMNHGQMTRLLNIWKSRVEGVAEPPASARRTKAASGHSETGDSETGDSSNEREVEFLVDNGFVGNLDQPATYWDSFALFPDLGKLFD